MIFLIRYKAYIKLYHTLPVTQHVETNINYIRIFLYRKSKGNNFYSMIFRNGAISGVNNHGMFQLFIDNCDFSSGISLHRYNMRYNNINYTEEQIRTFSKNEIVLEVCHMNINAKKNLLKRFVKTMLQKNRYISHVTRIYINGLYRGST